MRMKASMTLAAVGIALALVAGMTPVPSQAVEQDQTARFVTAAVTAHEYFVATDGDDGNAGTMEKPFATIGHAAAVMEPGDTCFIRGGTYRETISDETRALAGTKDAPIRFAAHGDEKVTISGGQPLDNWNRVGGAGNVWATSMDWDIYEGNGNMVFVDGNVCVEGRWPNAPVESLLDRDSYAVTKEGTPTGGLTIVDEAIPGDIDLTGARVWCASGNAYESIVFPITAHDRAAHTLTLGASGPGGGYNPRANNIYYVTHSLELLDAEGEWYKDVDDKTLYLYSERNLDDEAAPVIEAKRREYAVNLTRSSYVAFAGIDVYGALVSFSEDAHDCTFADATLESLDVCQGPETQKVNTAWQNGRGYARGIALGGTANTVSRCTIRTMFGEGVSVEGSGNFVVNNDIRDVNLEHSAFSEGVSVSGSNHLISHNTVKATGRGTIGGRYEACEIAYNDLSDACRLSRDAGVVYFNAHDYRNSQFHHNVVHDSMNNEGMQSGIYFDSFTTALVVHHNLVYNIEYDSFTEKDDPVSGNAIGWSRRTFSMNPHSLHNVVANNTFVNTAPLDFYHYDSNPRSDFSGTLIANNLFRSAMKWNSVDDLSTFGITAQHNLEGVQKSNVEYEFADFWCDSANADMAKRDFGLSDSSVAIDAGIAISGITDDVADGKPDCGCFEHGADAWTAGCDFTRDFPRTLAPSKGVPRTNLIANPGFEDYVSRTDPTTFELEGWEKSGAVRSVYNSAWSFWGEMAKDGSFALRLGDGDALTQHMEGLKPDTVYEIGGYGRVAGVFTSGNALAKAFTAGGTEISPRPAPETGIGAERVLQYDGIDFGAGANRMLVGVQGLTDACAGAKVEIALDDIGAEPIGSCTFEKATSRPDIRWEWLCADLDTEVTGTHKVFIRLVDGTGAATFAGKNFGGFLPDSSSAPDAVTITATPSSGDAAVVTCNGRRYASPEQTAYVKTGADGVLDIRVAKTGSALYGYVDQISVAEAFPGPCDLAFADENLYHAIVDQLQEHGVMFETDDSKRTVSMYATDIGKVTSLDLGSRMISKLDGIEGFVALSELDASNNRVSDLRPVGKLAYLKALNAHGNQVSDVSPIAQQRTLTYLDLSNNQLADKADGRLVDCTVYQLRYLGKLTHLDLSHNQLRLLHGAYYLANLEYLDVYDNAIRDIAGLASYENGAYVAKLTKLAHLDLGENNERDITAIEHLDVLEGLAGLTYLDFSENNTADIVSHVGGLSRLEFLQLQGNRITDASKLAGLANVRKLILRTNQIADIQPLLELSELRELNLADNALACTSSGSAATDSLHGVVKDGALAWPHLQKLSLDRNFYREGAYQQPPEMKTLYDLSLAPQGVELDYDYRTVPGVDFAAFVQVDSDGAPFVTYDSFSPRCDGVYDDYIAMRNAHALANTVANCEVRANGTATYHIYKLYDANAALALTDVDWRGARFTVHDEDIENKQGRFGYLFTLQNTDTGAAGASSAYRESRSYGNLAGTIGRSSDTIAGLDPRIDERLAELRQLGYSRLSCTATNAGTKQFVRTGANAGDGAEQWDAFIANVDGTLESCVQWDFKKVTSFTITPIPDKRSHVCNGTFTTNAVKSGGEAPVARSALGKDSYYRRGLQFWGCGNLDISNVNHDVATGGASGSYVGFVSLQRSADVSLSDCRLHAHKFIAAGRSTYDLDMSRDVGLRLENVTCNDLDDAGRWGVMGGNYLKDVSFDRCKLNRIDAHQGICNLAVTNCEIGVHGLSLCGQGDLRIEGTTVSAPTFIPLRSDYGSTWNGRASIVDCTHVCTGTGASAMFACYTSHEADGSLHDYGYECRFPEVFVDDFTIDNSKKPAGASGDYYVIPNNPDITLTDDADQAYWPESIVVNRVRFVGGTTLSRAPELHVSYANTGSISQGTRNYLVSDVQVRLGDPEGHDATRRLFEGEDVEADGAVWASIAETAAATNVVEVLKDGVSLGDATTIAHAWQQTFDEPGSYEVRLRSDSAGHHWKGERSLTFRVKSSTSEGSSGEGSSGEDDSGKSGVPSDPGGSGESSKSGESSGSGESGESHDSGKSDAPGKPGGLDEPSGSSEPSKSSGSRESGESNESEGVAQPARSGSSPKPDDPSGTKNGDEPGSETQEGPNPSGDANGSAKPGSADNAGKTPQEATFTITYKPNGGKGKTTVETKKANASVTVKANTFTRSGYRFRGWATRKSGRVSYRPGSRIQLTRNVTLYAVWSKIPRTPVFELERRATGDRMYLAKTPKMATKLAAMKRAGWKSLGVAFSVRSSGKAIYCLYDKKAGKHFYTARKAQVKKLKKKGWKSQGVAFRTPSGAKTPVYRLRNKASGSYALASKPASLKALKKAGWKRQGVAFRI